MKLPQAYASLSEQQAAEHIRAAKAALGSDLVILTHHYQRDSIVAFGDFVGDSLELSRRAAQVRDARYIVFCGVDFMAETAAMLCGPNQVVLIPDRTAMCPMAAMATRQQAVLAWDALTALWGDDLVPVTYQNSYADLKAFCGEHGGAVCTSANAQKVLQWAFSQRGHVIFFPDEHLGRNSALALGVPASQIRVWDPDAPDPQALRDARMIVWKGFCHVHTRFTTADVDAIRARYPDAKIVVHPECTAEVVARADAAASTSGIVRYVRDLPAGATVAIGTEIHLVERLAAQNPDKTVVPLARSQCGAMYRITPQALAYTLDELTQGRFVNRVRVPKSIQKWANKALERMLALA
ncbi:MAG: quinolinate synthase NadA [Anaerolineales bacterium]